VDLGRPLTCTLALRQPILGSIYALALMYPFDPYQPTVQSALDRWRDDLRTNVSGVERDTFESEVRACVCIYVCVDSCACLCAFLSLCLSLSVSAAASVCWSSEQGRMGRSRHSSVALPSSTAWTA
jgi:hypothetical protein